MRFSARTWIARRGRRPGGQAARAVWAGLPPRVKALAAGSVLAGLLAAAAAVAELAGSGWFMLWAANVSWTFAGVAALCGSAAAAFQLKRGSAVRGAWLLYTAAAGCWIVGAIIRDVQGPGILSPVAAVWWLGFAVLAIASFARRLPRRLIFVIFLLDALPVVLLIVAIVDVVNPAAGARPVDEVLLALYPALYGMLAANALQMMGIHQDLRRIPASVWLFSAGFCAMACAALFWGPAAVSARSAQGHITDVLWTVALLAVATAGLLRTFRPSGFLVLPPRARESGPRALPPAAALFGLILMLAIVPGGNRILLQAFLMAAAVSLFVRVYLMRREDLSLLAELARQQERAENAAGRAHRSAGRLRLLADVTSRLSSLKLNELMQAICDTAREVVGARFAAFGLAAGPRPEFTRFVVSGKDEQASEQTRQLPDGAVLLRSLRAGHAIRFDQRSNRRAAAVFPAGHPAPDSFLGVPVPIGPGRQGALYLTGKPGGFDEEDETLVTLLAVNAGHAVANAEHFEESQAQQEKLAQQNEQLRELDRMKDEFIALVSHELRTPLTSIMGFLELLEDEDAGELSKGQRRFVGVMHRNAQRLLHLVGDLLFLAGMQTGELAVEPRELDLAGVARSRVADAMSQAQAKRVAVTMVAHPAPAVIGDELRLAQLLDNLLSNAIKFTPAGGQVIVTVGTEGQRVALDVADTGIGIPARDLQHIFERFFRAATATNQAIPGTGLGLTICKAIVRAHGGTIEVSSGSGTGTRVRVRLPPYQPQPAPEPGLAGRPAQRP
jgi:signal transduction histidine kinase